MDRIYKDPKHNNAQRTHAGVPHQHTPKKLISKPRRKWRTYALVFLSCLFLLTSAVALYVWKVMNTQFPDLLWGGEEGSIRKTSEFNIVIAGLDEVGDVHRTDSIVVAHISLKEKTTGAIFVPRDLRVEIPGYGFEKINGAYARGNSVLLMKTLEHFLNVPVNYYFVLRLEAFEHLINTIGGVEIDVEKNMRYTDRAQNLHINLHKGAQLLNGTQAMQYARFRHDPKGDLGRIERQQKLINALAKKALSLDMLNNLPALLAQLQKEQLILTNLSLSDGIFLMKFLNDQSVKQNVRMFTLPGEPQMLHGISYVIPDYDEMPYMIAGVLRGGYHPRNEMVKIIVENGSGFPGIAETYARRLTYYGFDTSKKSSSNRFNHDKTLLIVHKKTPFDNAIARLLDAEIQYDPQPDAPCHITIIIGKDKSMKTNRAAL
ncbi:MAG: LCP family protein [bacterium]